MKKVLKVAVTFIATLLVCFACFSCNSKAQEVKVRVEPAEMSASQLIMFEFYNIEDAIYSKDNMNFYLEYMDVDAFDLDCLAAMTGRERWYGDYIAVDLQDSLVSQFLIDWNEYLGLRKRHAESWKPEMGYDETWQKIDKLSESYAIREIWYYDSITNQRKDIRYELVYVGPEFNWYE